MATVVVRPLRGAGVFVWLGGVARWLFSSRTLRRLTGAEVVVLQGRALAVRPVPLGIARDLVPAMVRCSRRFAEWDLNEALYDDMVEVLALGLRAPRRDIESLTVSLWDLAPVIETIARVNGMPVQEAGSIDMGKLLAALKPTGTSLSPGSSAPPAGPGSISSNA